MPLDQSHEQTNKIIKGEGGAVGLTENASALNRWMLAGLEVSRVVNQFETSMPENTLSNEHHEKAHHVQESFSGHVKSLVVVLDGMGNPFLEESDELLVLDSKNIKGTDVIYIVKTIEHLRDKEYRTYVKQKFVQNSRPITDTIQKNKLPFFSTTPDKAKSNNPPTKLH